MKQRTLFTILPSLVYSFAVCTAACSSGVELADSRQKSSATDGTGGADTNGSGGTPASTTEESGGTPASTGDGAGGSAGTPAADDGGAAPANDPAACDTNPACRVLSFRAHASGDGTAFVAQAGSEGYECFASHFAPDDSLTGVLLTPVLPDSAIPHHVDLYKSATPVYDGNVEACAEKQSSSDVEIGEWAPGTGPIVLHGPAAAAATPGDYILKLHYVNASIAPVGTRAGFDLCVCPR